ncbi:hypothetical protein BOS5A_80077 [Bosea sp. EC-HK365B]|nr:hypothetical protein BOSE21B_111470 [Bosea sp. 21B]VVT62417.1 hypothetical protein BOS5A_80077 [Bosea sp. EC-HK365B]
MIVAALGPLREAKSARLEHDRSHHSGISRPGGATSATAGPDIAGSCTACRAIILRRMRAEPQHRLPIAYAM